MMYVLDRFEEDYAIFVGDDETLLTLPAENFREYREGDVFSGIDTGELHFESDETTRRREDVRERFRKLHKRKK